MLNHDICPYPYVDLHSHVQFDDFDVDRKSILQEMQDKNIITILVGTTIETSLSGVSLASQYSDRCYSTIGLHPVHAEENKEDELTQFEKHVTAYAQNSHVVGIGECGMDFFRVQQADSDFSYQGKVFEHQIQLAKKYDMPLMLHVRDSYQKTLTILSKYFNHTDVEYRGNAHFFVGSIEEAQAFLDLGFSISFTGVITFVPAYEELVRYVPLERMFAETDSPYVSPVPYRGKKNTPVHVIEIYKKIAEIKGVPIEVVRETLYKNACRYWFKDRVFDNSVS